MKPKTKPETLEQAMQEFSTKLAKDITHQMSEFMTKHWELMLEIWIADRKEKIKSKEEK